MAYKVIVLGAGKGKRMGAGKNKLLLELDHVPILIHTLNIFEDDPLCEEIILVVSPDDENEMRSLVEQYKINKVGQFVYGGTERQHSVYNGLMAIKEEGIVLVHDGARPFVEKEKIHELVKNAAEHGSSILAVRAKDTIKKVHQGFVAETVDRSSLWMVQTPQAFRSSILKKAHQRAKETNFVGTDDASLVEQIHDPVKIVEGSYDNIKITTVEDLYFAEAILKNKRENKTFF